MEDYISKVYIQTDSQGRILRCDGGYTAPADLTGWIEIDKGTGDRYNLCQTTYFVGGLASDDGIPLYRWDGTQVVERTPEEIEADRAEIPAPPPSETEQLRAKVEALEAEKAERAELEAMAAAIERGLSA